jgi:hypothetical protein
MEESKIDLPRRLKFLLDREQLLCELFADPAKHNVSLHPRPYHRGGKRFVNVVHSTDIESPCLLLDMCPVR